MSNAPCTKTNSQFLCITSRQLDKSMFILYFLILLHLHFKYLIIQSLLEYLVLTLWMGKKNYTPPCSHWPDPKIYVLTIHALNTQPTITVPNTQVTMDILLARMKNKIVDSAVMSVIYKTLI